MPRARCSSRPFLALITGVALAVGALASTATAQSLWMARDGEQTLMLEVLKPELSGFDQELFSAAFFLSGRGAVSPRISVVGELPFVRHQSAYQYFGPFDVSSSMIGNPYAGLELQLASGPAFLELGVRPPLAADDEALATRTGNVSDVTRWEAFTPERFAILAAFNIREVTPSKIAFRLRVGPTLALPTGNNNPSETILYAVYSFQVGYQGSKARVGAGMSGRSQITQELDRALFGFGGVNMGERSLSQFELHADFLPGRVRPGLDLHVPLDALSGASSSVVGVNLTWTR